MDRLTLRTAIAEALEPYEFVRAAWEGGSAAFERDDEWSDIDLQVIAEPEHAEQVFDVAYETIESLGGIGDLWRLPDPTWHGNRQAFIRPATAPEHLMVDLVVIEAGGATPFQETEIHGRPTVFFDKDGVVGPTPFDRAAARARMLEVLATRRIEVRLFGHAADKGAARRNTVGAIDALHHWVLRPLHEALRMLHVPDRWDWSTQYLRRDLPDEVADRLDALWSVTDLDDVPATRAEAAAWFEQVAAEVEEREASGE
ncbi:MAG TPA: hypothetical protein VLD62_03920 [Acidimicrobiia bacterium]|nr:hypothetical protein [Acidimicrobiia bacterium]